MMQGSESEEDTVESIKALYTLVFDEENRDKIRNDKSAMTVLYQLKHSNHQEIQHSACGALWEIKGRKDSGQQAGTSDVIETDRQENRQTKR